MSRTRRITREQKIRAAIRRTSKVQRTRRAARIADHAHRLECVELATVPAKRCDPDTDRAASLESPRIVAHTSPGAFPGTRAA